MAAENDFGATNREVATLAVALPLLTVEPVLVDGALRIWLPGGMEQDVIVETSTTLAPSSAVWLLFHTHPAQAAAMSLDIPTADPPRKFIRARLEP